MAHINLITCKSFTFFIIFVFFVSFLFLLFISFFLACFFLKKEVLRFFETLLSLSQCTTHNSQDLNLHKEEIFHRMHVWLVAVRDELIVHWKGWLHCLAAPEIML